MPWSASSSGVSFLAPRRRILVAPLAKASEIELRPGAKPWRSVAVGRPARGQVVLVLGEDDVGVAQAAVVGHGADAGPRAADVLLHEPERAPDARPGRALGVGAEAAEAGVEADLPADRPVDDDHGKRAARCRLELLAAGLGIEERVHRGHQHRQVLGPPARHRERDGADLDGGDPAARRKRAEHVRARQRAALQDPLHALARRRPQGQAVAPQVREHQVVGPDQGVLERRPADGDHGDLARPRRRPGPTSSASARRRTRACAPRPARCRCRAGTARSGTSPSRRRARARGRRWRSS